MCGPFTYVLVIAAFCAGLAVAGGALPHDYGRLLLGTAPSILGFMLALEIYTRTKFNAAADSLVSAFAEELTMLNSPQQLKGDDIRNMFLQKRKEHGSAVIRFRRYVPGHLKAEYDDAWNTHNLGHDKHWQEIRKRWPDKKDLEGINTFIYYSISFERDDDETSKRDLAIRNVERILHFTERHGFFCLR